MIWLIFTHMLFNLINFYEYLLQKNIGDYEEQNKDVKVRDNSVLFKYSVLMTLNEATNHYSKHGLKEIFEPDKKEMEMLNKHITNQFEDLKK